MTLLIVDVLQRIACSSFQPDVSTMNAYIVTQHAIFRLLDHTFSISSFYLNVHPKFRSPIVEIVALFDVLLGLASRFRQTCFCRLTLLFVTDASSN